MTGTSFFLLDACVFFSLTWFTLYLRHGGLTWAGFCHQLWAFLPIFLFVSFTLWLFSFYDMKLLRKRMLAYKRLALAFAITLFGTASVIYFVAALPLSIPTPRRILLVILTGYFLYIYLFRRNYFKLDNTKTNLLLFGKSPTLDELFNEAKHSRGRHVRGYEKAPDSHKRYNLTNLDLVVIGSKLFNEQPQAWQEVAKEFIAKGICVDTDFNVYERTFCRASRESIEDNYWLLRSVGKRQEHLIYHVLKRISDLLLALLLLPVCVPLGILIALCIRFIDGYSPLFIQKRVGQLGKPIYIYKFRTIKPGAEQTHITRCGNFLRRFRLDEIPQLINVLKGDISFVGPRPLWHHDNHFLQQHIPNHTLRTLVKPGITGWAQLNFKAPPNYVHACRAASPADTHVYDAAWTRFAYDIWYIKHRSFSLDLEILIRTGIRMFIRDEKVNAE